MNGSTQLLDVLAPQATYEVVECNDKTHCHRSPFQHIFSGYRNGHFVELTIDGDRCNVRVDDDPFAKIDVSFDVASAYVEQKTQFPIPQKGG